MTAIFPVPTTRVSDAMVTRRLLSELQTNEADLLKVQSQVSTGRRLAAPSEDPTSAVIAIGLQRVLEQKQQIQANIETGQSYLTATDNTIGAIHGILADARGQAITATGDTADDQVRLAARAEIVHALDELVSIGNRSFRGRYLFAGSQTEVTPFETRDGLVQYNGNRRAIRGYSDLEMLFDSNVTGDEVFGAISAEVRGAVDLTPRLTQQTRLSDLHGGQGIAAGSIAISDGSTTRTIDVQDAETVGDLVQLIEANSPAGRTITVDVDPVGLVINIDAAGGGNLTVREVGSGRTAEELGILRVDGAGTAPIVGQELSPRLTLTTRLSDVLDGTWDQSSGMQVVNGDQTYTLTFDQAETVEDLLNTLNGADAGLWAEIDEGGSAINLLSRRSGGDFHVGENGGTTATDLGLRSLTRGTPLADLNFGQGVHTVDGTDFTIQRSDGVELDIDVSGAVTVGDVLDLISNHPNNLTPTGAIVAQFPDYGNGITLYEDNPTGPVTLTVTRSFGSMAARDLRLIPAGADQSTASPVATAAAATIQLPPPDDLNTGFTVSANTPGTALNDVEVVLTGGAIGDVANVTFDSVGRQLLVDIDPTQTTTNTIIAAIAAEGTFGAALDTSTDPTNDGTGLFTAVGTLAATSGGAASKIAGDDPNPLETSSVFNTLVRLSDAIEQNDPVLIERAVNLLDEDMQRARFAQAEAGARVRGLDALQRQLEDEEVQLKESLSQEVDMDLAEAISNLTARQVAYEAALRSASMVFSMSLLDFL